MLSVIIPAKNEQYLEKTIRNILENAEGEIEIIVELDGYIPDPQIDIGDNRVIFVHHVEGVGQRQCINHGASIAKGKFIMKLDAHCAVDKGFDIKLAKDCEYDWTVIPTMYNLDIETWKPKLHKITNYMYISSMKAEKPFRATYYEGREKDEKQRQPVNDKMIDDIMCCMGPGFFMHKERFLELGGCDEGHGGWGQQGIELGCKAWLSGGRLVVNKNTWFAHWFRGGGGPGFPYEIGGREQEKARKYSQDLWLNDKWPLAKRKFQWLIDKFNPPGWKKRYGMVTVIIPSRKEKFLNNTINDVLKNATGEIEVIVVLDGYDKEDEVERIEGVKYICLPDNGECQKRQGINTAVSIARGEYVMSLDAHCMVGPGFDEIMARDCEDNMVMIPRRYKLEPESWTTRLDVPAIDYEYWLKQEYDKGILKPYRWDRPDRADVMIDDTLTMQASCWFMKKDWFKKMNFMRLEGYTGWGQEDVEICLETYLAGGRCVVNKNTWYAHLFKGKTYGRMYHMPRSQYNISREWAFNHWCVERKEEFWKVLRMFPDLPRWHDE